MPRLDALDEWSRARDDLDRLTASRDFRAAADELHALWPRHPPDYFAYTSQTRRYRIRRAFGNGDGWAARLVMAVNQPAHFTLHARHLDLDPSAAAPHLLFDRANVARWKAAIAAHFWGPHRWKLELGDEGRVHAHVLADLSDGPPNIRRGGRIVRACDDYLEQVVGYLCKPALVYTAEHLAVWLEARAGGRRLPQLSGASGLRSHLRKLTPEPADDRAPSTPDAAPSLDEPQLPAPASLTAPSLTSRASTSRPSARFGNLVDRLVATTAPPALSEGVCRLQSYPVRRTQHRRPPRARGPPGSASTAPQPSPSRANGDTMTDEPQLAADLEARISSLRNRCRNAPRNSYSAQQTAAYLDRLERDGSLSSAEKLAGVRRASRELTEDLRLNSDTINHSPDSGPDSNPRPRRK